MEDTPTFMDAQNPESNGQDQAKKSHKRKREFAAVETLSPEQQEAQMEALTKEMQGLFRYYREMMGQTSDLLSGLSDCSSVNAMVAVLMEEKSSPLSKLVNDIYPKVKEKVDSVTMAAVKSAVVFVGQRVMYGVPNAEADVLEDDTESCLWCWETRDLKMIPKSARGMLKIRRTCRKKIHERISVVSAMIAALRRVDCDKICRIDLNTAAVKLGRILGEADIRLFVDKMLQKNSVEMAKKDAKREEKMVIKQLERTKREAEKEKKRVEREMLKEKLQYEKDQKRLKEEVEKDEKHKENEESGSWKRLKKQQEDTEREQKRREKEQAELKKQLAIQKQASIMQRFLKKNKKTSSLDDLPSGELTALDSSSKECENAIETVIDTMDKAFTTTCATSIDDLRRLHLSSWCKLGHSIRSNSKQHWGMRRKPKVELYPEIKLSINRGITSDNELIMEKPVAIWEEKNLGDASSTGHCDLSSSGLKKSRRSMQLLQFDKSYRPAFYGIWPNQSQVVRPRQPLRKDPNLDYEVDSDEEWEEEEPGESLSDCEKDEEECLEEGCPNADDEDDNEDGFFVPDGYLSADEGVQVDRMEVDSPKEDARSLPNSKQDQESEEFRALLRQQKHLHNLTEHALKKSQPLIICNLAHEKTALLSSRELDGTLKLEQICLQALIMRTFPGSPAIGISIDNTDEDQEICESSCSYSSPPTSSARTILDSNLLTVVSVIQSCSQGMNKLVETLQQKFHDVPKTELRNRVREISEFEDNRWRVKKETLAKLGLSSSPDKVRIKGISSFFSKRCLPPSTSTNPIKSPESPLKPKPMADEQQGCKRDCV